MNQRRYLTILWHISNLEHATEYATVIANKLRFPDTDQKGAYLSGQLDILKEHISTSARIARTLATDLPQIMEVSYD